MERAFWAPGRAAPAHPPGSRGASAVGGAHAEGPPGKAVRGPGHAQHAAPAPHGLRRPPVPPRRPGCAERSPLEPRAGEGPPAYPRRQPGAPLPAEGSPPRQRGARPWVLRQLPPRARLPPRPGRGAGAALRCARSAQPRRPPLPPRPRPSPRARGGGGRDWNPPAGARREEGRGAEGREAGSGSGGPRARPGSHAARGATGGPLHAEGGGERAPWRPGGAPRPPRLGRGPEDELRGVRVSALVGRVRGSGAAARRGGGADSGPSFGGSRTRAGARAPRGVRGVRAASGRGPLGPAPRAPARARGRRTARPGPDVGPGGRRAAAPLLFRTPGCGPSLGGGVDGAASAGASRSLKWEGAHLPPSPGSCGAAARHLSPDASAKKGKIACGSWGRGAWRTREAPRLVRGRPAFARVHLLPGAASAAMSVASLPFSV